MKKGFTLIELLAVIIILGVLGVIALTTVDKNVKTGIYKSCLAQEKILKEAAKSYSIDYPNFSGTKTVTELENAGYLEKNTKNPATDAPYGGSTSIKITLSGSKYTYSIVYANANESCESQKVD